MKMNRVAMILLAGVVLAACSRSEAPAPAAAAAPAGATASAVKAEAKKEEKHEAPDIHGMPGMSELFKGDDKKPEGKK